MKSSVREISTFLKLGLLGAAVPALQTKLKECNFAPGGVRWNANF